MIAAAKSGELPALLDKLEKQQIAELKQEEVLFHQLLPLLDIT